MKPQLFNSLDPSAINQLVEQGYEAGTLSEAARIFDEISLRDAGFSCKREAVANSGETDNPPSLAEPTPFFPALRSGHRLFQRALTPSTFPNPPAPP